ncbi:GLPGLI family protein [Paenimyroides tangerinum]|uniref:GLPGLI family protein n=1 Tax=Paenimyroides tangerinum TaxID=2488728 RepID=UPI001315ACBF|nr:GLPGLI family protein [Paenimyroides tangerinum]
MFFFIIFSSLNCKSQNDVVFLNYKVFYDFKRPLSRDVYMTISDQKALYVEKNNSTVYLKNEAEFVIPDNKDDESLYTDVSNYVIQSEYKYDDKFIVQNLVLNKLFETVQDPYFGNFISEESIANITWNLENEFKTINEVECQKAIGSFRGLQWKIWFSMKYPIPFGPWKLFGAPGLIFEASTLDKKVTYLLQSIKSGNMIIDDTLPKYKLMTLENLVKFMDENSDVINDASRNYENRTKVVGYRNLLEPKYEWEE